MIPIPSTQSGRMDFDAADSLPPLQRQQLYHSESHRLLSKALDIDVTSPSEAARYYRQAIMVMKRALDICFEPEDAAQAAILDSKLLQNLHLVQDRLHKIETEYMSSSTDMKYPTRPASGGQNKPASSYTSSSSSSQQETAMAVRPQYRMHSARAVKGEVEAPSRRRPIEVPSGTIPNPSVLIEDLSAVSRGKAAAAPNKSSRDDDDAVRQARIAKGYKALQGIDKSIQSVIMRDIVDDGPGVKWSDVVGLEAAKAALMELVVYPALRPDVFTGILAPAKGLLLFGPPGTGKTMLARAVATEAKSTFFSVSAATLTAKYLGDSEKLVRALFTIARMLQPSIIFIDEIDSILGERGGNEHDSVLRLKNEFLMQLEGVTTDSDERLLVLGATNRPEQLDEAAIRRLSKRIYIPLPCADSRMAFITKMMSSQRHKLSRRDLESIAQLTEGYSGSDLRNLCKDAAMGPVREVGMTKLMQMEKEKLRPVDIRDFRAACRSVRPSVRSESLAHYDAWNTKYGVAGV